MGQYLIPLDGCQRERVIDWPLTGVILRHRGLQFVFIPQNMIKDLWAVFLVSFGSEVDKERAGLGKGGYYYPVPT